MEKFLLDSNIVSEPSKPMPNEKVLQALSLYKNESVISSVSYFELLRSVLRLPEGRRKNRLQAFLDESVVPFYEILPYDFSAAKIHAHIISYLESVGSTSPYADTQIAAIALANNLTLVTRNVDDFSNIANKFSLQIENWFVKYGKNW